MYELVPRVACEQALGLADLGRQRAEGDAQSIEEYSSNHQKGAIISN